MTQEEEQNQLFCQLSVVFLVRSIHFVHDLSLHRSVAFKGGTKL